MMNSTIGIKHIVLLLVLCLYVHVLSAQNSNDQLRAIYDAAEMNYDIGRIEEARKQLGDNVKSFSGNLRQSAYRLLSLCALAEDDNVAAENYVRLLLHENPYYSTALGDPQRFIDMVERISGRSENTITTASSHEERLSEVPVPTTLITEQMIRDSGARNLQEVLAAYVPGMNIVDCNDDINIAMRGIFSNGQEMILIMLDGHRLNSYCTNIASPDFSIGLEKLKQIEVLRGPASSLYGGVALTAVVNLITKKGADVDGLKVKAGYGNHSQWKGDVLFGKRYYDLDVMLWGSLYRSSGELRDVPLNVEQLFVNSENHTVTVGAIGRKPTYELGIKLMWKDLQFMYDTHFSQVRSPYTISTTAAPYAYDKYRTYNGMHPGYATNAHHANLKYSRQMGRLVLDGMLTFDSNDLTHYQVIGDDTIPWLGELIGVDTDTVANIFKDYGGTSRYINGQEMTFGAQVKGDLNYLSTGAHSGYLTFGAEYSHFTLDDVRYTIGYDFVNSTPENITMSQMGKGSENSYNAFLQLKHQWHSLIFNAGLRYDHKVRFDDSRVNELSPRLALIYVKPKWNMKLSYSKSFVDAPYLYQKMNQFMTLMELGDLEDYLPLKPEKLHSLQFTMAGRQWLQGLDFEMNFFYNQAEDVLFTELLRQTNSGKNKTIGLELMAQYKHGPLSANFNTTWIKTLMSNLTLYKDIVDNNSTPSLTSNLVVGWQATKKLRLHTKATFQTEQRSYNVSFTSLSIIRAINDLIDQAYEDEDEEAMEMYGEMRDELITNDLVSDLHVGSRLVIDLGAEYRIGALTLGLNVHNLLNRTYYQGGMNTALLPQRGRWFMGTVAYEF